MRYFIGILTLGWVGVALGITYTVDDDGPADFNNIQDAIDWAWHDDVIEVQPGFYREPGLNLYGKRLKVTSVDPTDETIVASTIIDGNGESHIIVAENGEQNDTVLSGFTLQNGGTAIYCSYSGLLISYCYITNISTSILVYGSPIEMPYLYACYFNEESIFSFQGVIDSCVFSGGIIYNCNNIIKNCIVTKYNISASGGIQQCHGLIANCIVSGCFNGIKDCRGDVINCTLVGNQNDGYLYESTEPSSGSVRNCIIVNNNRYGICSYYDVPINIEYNNIWNNGQSYRGLPPNPLDIHTDPQFALDGYWEDTVNWIEGDYHLKSEAGRWDSALNTWVVDTVTSHCIDAGNPTDNIEDEPLPHGGRINMGAYGGTAQASLSPGQAPDIVSGLTVTGGHRQLHLEWDDPNDASIINYRIYRGPDSESLELHEEIAAGEYVFTDLDVVNNESYTYAIASVNPFGEGTLSTPVTENANWNDYDLDGDGYVNLIDLSLIVNNWLWSASWVE